MNDSKILQNICFCAGVQMVRSLPSYFILTLLAVFLFLPGLTNLPVLDRDEAHFAQASRQMIQSGNYFTIRFQDITRFQKPPGINWLQSASVLLVSDADKPVIWPYRLPSFLNAFAAVLLLFFFARRFVGESTAQIAAALLAVSLLMNIEAHMAVIDTSLLVSVILMQGALWVIYANNREKRKVPYKWAILFWTAMAYGFVLKGVTPLVGFLSIGCLWAIERNHKCLRGLHPIGGGLLFIGLTLIWSLLVNQAEGTNYIEQMFYKDLLPKLQGGHESHGFPPLFHLVILPITFWPGSLFLPLAITYAWQNRSGPVVRFLFAWLIPTWVFFELMPTKLPQYVLPTFPVLAILSALAIKQAKNFKKSANWQRILYVLWGIMTIGLSLGVIFVSHFLVQRITTTAMFLAIEMMIFTLLSIYFVWIKALQRACLTVVFMAIVTFSTLFSVFLPSMQPLWISEQIAQCAKNIPISAQHPLLVVGEYSEPSIVFKFNTKNVLYTNKEQALGLMEKDKEYNLLIDNDQYQTVMTAHPNWTATLCAQGFNYSKGRSAAVWLVSAGE